MAKLNVKTVNTAQTHEGGSGIRPKTEEELRRLVQNCLLWEPTFYVSGDKIAARIAELIKQVKPEFAASLAIDAREKFYLRHVPLFIVRELARIKGNGPIVRDILARVIQRVDELTEYCAIYWKDKRQPLSAGSKQGLAQAFRKFNEYALAKYDREGKVKLRDVLFLCHAKPVDQTQADLWKRLVDGKLETPDTWEVALSAGKDKKATWERLLSEGKLGGLAVLRNLRNMQEVGVDEKLIRSRLTEGISKAFPYRFVVAAKHAPCIEDAIELAMLKAVEGMQALPGKTGLLIDVSGSMDYRIGNQNESRTHFISALVAQQTETSRIDVAAGLAILLREKAESVRIATFSNGLVGLPPRRGFALRDAIQSSQPHGATYLANALTVLKNEWPEVNRMIVITDEQSQDGSIPAWAEKSYIVNVAPNEVGVGYHSGWTHVNGWSDRIVEWIMVEEGQPAEGAA